MMQIQHFNMIDVIHQNAVSLLNSFFIQYSSSLKSGWTPSIFLIAFHCDGISSSELDTNLEKYFKLWKQTLHVFLQISKVVSCQLKKNTTEIFGECFNYSKIFLSFFVNLHFKCQNGKTDKKKMYTLLNRVLLEI